MRPLSPAVLGIAFLFTISLRQDQKPAAPPLASAAPAVQLPLKSGSVRFAVIGDNGTGQQPEFEVANQMERFRKVVKYDFVVMDGDNIYGGHKASDFQRKFEEPYKPLLDAGVKFYASLGNHDDPDIERNYKLYNMGGQRYYTFHKGDAEFFALDSNYMDPQQLSWLENQLKDSDAKWKICFFHHPMFTAATYHGPDLDLRKRLMPLFTKYGVNLVLSGHEHVYERIKPQNGLYLFVLGNSGELRFHNLRPNNDVDQVGFDIDRDFMMMEISGNELYYQTISRTGTTIDSGELDRQGQSKP
ncbi:MAG TPA: metallophosphoesterase [Acidobacteriaceae bacterium]